MKLLFDQNLSPRLAEALADLYPGSTHVREVRLHDADDDTVWAYAARHGFAIVSKDADTSFPTTDAVCRSALSPASGRSMRAASTALYRRRDPDGR